MKAKARRQRAILRDRRRGCWGHPIGGSCHNCAYDTVGPSFFELNEWMYLLITKYMPR